MKKSLVKKNLTLFSVIIATGVVSLVLLLYVIWQCVTLIGYQDRINKAQSKGKTLVRQKPNPGNANEQLIREDIVTYQKAAEALRKQFKSPLQSALDEFFVKLQPPLAAVMTEEEVEAYKVPGTGVEADPENNVKAVPLKIRKLTQDEFVVFFRGKFDKYCEDNGKSDEERNKMSTLTEFMGSGMQFFPKGNWNQALEAFVRKARLLTCEPINASNQVAVLLSALGLPRLVSDDVQAMQRHVDEIVEKIGKNAAASHLTFAPGALDFVGGMSADQNSSRGANPVMIQDYPIALFHWDVFGDIVKRLGSAGGEVSVLHQVLPRASAADEEEGRSRESLNLAGSFEQVGSYLVFHYTVKFSGSMDGIRKALQAFDQAHKENRTYVVRSLCLYARENGAAVIMDQSGAAAPVVDSTVAENNDDNRSRRGRRGRRGRRVAQEEEVSSDRESDVQAQIAAREAALPPHQRSDYGMIRIGGSDLKSECVAMLDIDYVVLAPNR